MRRELYSAGLKDDNYLVSNTPFEERIGEFFKYKPLVENTTTFWCIKKILNDIYHVTDGDIPVSYTHLEEGLRENAMTVAENIMTANKDIDFLFGGNQTCTMGAVSAVEAAGANVKVVGVDIDTEMVQAIKDGKLFATVAQQPIVLGSTAIETALNKLKGEEIPKRITIPVLLVSQENLEEATQALEILDY